MMIRLMVPATILAASVACGTTEGTFEGEPIDCTWFADTR